MSGLTGRTVATQIIGQRPERAADYQFATCSILHLQRTAGIRDAASDLVALAEPELATAAQQENFWISAKRYKDLSCMFVLRNRTVIACVVRNERGTC